MNALFQNLEVVHLEGNPVFNEVDYKTVALAYLKHLKFLDYKLVDPDEVRHSREACQDDLMELEDNEALEAAAKERDDVRTAHLQKLAVRSALRLYACATHAGPYSHTCAPLRKPTWVSQRPYSRPC